MNILKAYIERKKVKNYYKSYYYKNSFYAYDFFERYNLIETFDKTFSFSSLIHFKGKIEFNISSKEIFIKLGESRYTSNHEEIKNYQILHYKNKINDLKNRSQLHIYNDMFFYGIQLFPYLSSIQKEELIQLLKNKYSIPSDEHLPFKIKDKQNNILFVSDNLNLSLDYITGNEMMLSTLFATKEKILNKTMLRLNNKKQALIDIL
ncbi:MAG TPA: hypothetical protein PLP65_05450 [Bacteroidales bacterium]|nr:hypothetical protein [Bacteroidales bacterium]